MRKEMELVLYTPKNNNVILMRRSRPLLTKYEITKVIASRVQQIADGAESYLPNDHEVNPRTANPMRVAVAELEEGVIPLMIPREMPDGTVEVWRLSELRLPPSFMKHVRSLDIA